MVSAVKIRNCVTEVSLKRCEKQLLVNETISYKLLFFSLDQGLEKLQQRCINYIAKFWTLDQIKTNPGAKKLCKRGKKKKKKKGTNRKTDNNNPSEKLKLNEVRAK